jgi:hypothetical protein
LNIRRFIKKLPNKLNITNPQLQHINKLQFMLNKNPQKIMYQL